MENVQIQRVFTIDKNQLNKVKDFLSDHDLELEMPVDALYVAKADETIVATGAIQGKIIKMLAVDSGYRGSNLIAMMVSELTNHGFQMGQDHLFIYTKPESASTFRHVGFYEIVKTDHVALLENRMDGISDHLRPLVNTTDKDTVKPKHVGAVVVNCNPFTNGHKHLIETASSSVDLLYVFVLSEDRSTFPFTDRLELVEEGTKHLSNIVVFPTGPYMVSQATFPTYFLGEDKDKIMAQTELDARLFGARIASALGINTRFLGEEPFNEVTAEYNQSLLRVLGEYGVKVNIIKRKEQDGKAISASNVRAYLASGNWDDLKLIVPETTWNYLISDRASRVIEKIRKEAHLHKRV